MFNHLLRILFIASAAVSILACQRSAQTNPTATVRISAETDPQTLDPRQTRDLGTATVIHMLYEGLMRVNEEGLPSLAIAEDVNVSNDQKTYTFKLRNSAWSNGKPVTASDFEQTWKSSLDPKYPSPNAYQLFAIKGAKAAKEGQLPLSEVAIKAIDDSTLVVELEQPTPYFLNLVATYFYYPVSQEMRDKKASVEKFTAQNSITNGPFQLEEWSQHNQLIAVKNPYYWDKNEVEIDRVEMLFLDNSTALSLFDKNELDWAGSPLSTIPTDALATLKKQNQLHSTPAAGVYLFRFNTEKAPFDQVKMRKALSLALNRQELVDHVLQGNQTPAMGLIPPVFIDHSSFFRDYNLTQAQQMFKEALAAMRMSKEDLPSLTLCYSSGERSHKIAQVAQQQWKKAFDIDVKLQSCESKVYFDRLKSRDYQISIGSWFADFRDSISFLEVFKSKENGTNNTGWENPHFIKLLNLSAQTSDSTQREKLLIEAELTLLEDMPVCPLFFNTYNYLKQPHLKGVYFSELGYVDFKNAYIVNKER